MTTDPQSDEVDPRAIPIPEAEVDLDELTDEQREGYEKTLEISRKAAGILSKIARAASTEANAPSIRLKAHDCWDFMTWITTIQNMTDMQQQKISYMEAVIGEQAQALQSKKLWRPGPA